MSELSRLGSQMGDAFRTAREENEEARKRISDPPVDGTYEAQIQNCVRQATKSGTGQYILTEYYISSGEYTGKVEYNRLMLIPERLRSVESFFSSFGFDTTELCCDNPDDIIDSWCAKINQVKVQVRIQTKRWFKKDESGAVTSEIGGCNVYIKSILTDDWSPIDDAQPDKSEIETDETNSDEDNNLRLALNDICESQGIGETEAKEGVGEIGALELDDLIEVMKSYTFKSEELTPDEIETLIKAGLDTQINYPEKKENKKSGAMKTSRK